MGTRTGWVVTFPGPAPKMSGDTGELPRTLIRSGLSRHLLEWDTTHPEPGKTLFGRRTDEWGS